MKWVSVFKYLSIEYGENIAFAMDQTQRVSFESNADGDKLRIRFTNRYGRNSLSIAHATIGKEKLPYIRDVADITFGGQRSVVLQPGQELFCDEINYNVWAGERMVVSIYFGDRQDIDSVCCFWADGGARVQWLLGDVTNGLDADMAPVAVTAPYILEDSHFNMLRMFTGFDAVQVMASDEVRTIACFGDSITHMSFYTNALTRRFYDGFFGKVSLINSGIGGNRLVADATYVPEAGRSLVFFGEAGVKRFERDVFELDEIDAVLVLIGINDIMHPVQFEGLDHSTAAGDIIAGYRKIIDCAHEKGAKVFFGTITPCGSNDYPAKWLSIFEDVRGEVNSWIRKGEEFDGFFDFDRELADPDKPGFMKSAYHLGDGLHPGNAGGRKMAECVDLQVVLRRYNVL